jgi:hypothetical protein
METKTAGRSDAIERSGLLFFVGMLKRLVKRCQLVELQRCQADYLLIVVRFAAALMTARMLHMRFRIIVIIMRNQPWIGMSLMMVIKEELDQLPFCRSKCGIGRENISAFKLLLTAPFISVSTLNLNRLA